MERERALWTRAELAAALLLLVLAAVVRMARPGLTEFKADEGRLLTLALQTAGGDVAASGIDSSVGFPNAPMSVWLYALPLTVWRHPYSATLFTGLLSALSLIGGYWLVRRYWGPTAALAALLMVALGPWAIVFSRKIWAQNLLPLFAVGWAIGAIMTFVEGRKPFILIHLVCLAVAVQIHPAAIGLVPATLLFLVVFRRNLDWRFLLLGGALAALTATPYLWYLWGRWRGDGLVFSTRQPTAETSLDSLRLILTLASGDGIGALAGEGFAGPPGWAAARWLWLGLVCGGALWLAGRAARHWSLPVSRVGFIILAWFFVPALLFVWHRTPVYIHYFIAVLPAPFIIAGALFGRLVSLAQPGVRTIAWVVLFVAAGLQLWAWAGAVRYSMVHPLESGIGTPLQLKLAAADEARALARANGASEILLAGDGADPRQNDFPAEFRALLDGVPLRYVDLNAEALFPAGASVVLVDVAAVDEPTSVREIYATSAAETRTIPVSEELDYTVHLVPSGAAPAADVALPEAALLSNFVRLIGHGAPRFEPDGVLWDVYWHPAENPDVADYHFFNHLIDVTGARVGQADGAAFAGAQWRAGDTIVSRFLLPLAPDAAPPLTMRVGMYRFPSLENVPVLDAAANPAADAVEWALER